MKTRCLLLLLGLVFLCAVAQADTVTRTFTIRRANEGACQRLEKRVAELDRIFPVQIVSCRVIKSRWWGYEDIEATVSGFDYAHCAEDPLKVVPVRDLSQDWERNLVRAFGVKILGMVDEYSDFPPVYGKDGIGIRQTLLGVPEICQ